MIRKTLLAAALALSLVATPAFALSQFYKADSGQWTIEGYTGEKNFCAAKTYWGSDSYISLFNMRGSSVFSLMIHNEDWNIADAPGLYDMEIEFTGSAGYRLMNGTYELRDNQTIIVRNLTDAFIVNWIEYRNMAVLMQGNIPDFRVGLIGTRDSIEVFSECIDMLNGEIGD